MSAAGGYTSRKFFTEELLVKLNTVLEQQARQQQPFNPSVDAYKHENDKVEHYLNVLKKNPDDPYLRAQLHQAMEDKQHLYNLIQGNKNPFKTETSTSEGTQTQTTKSATTQSDVLSEWRELERSLKHQNRDRDTNQAKDHYIIQRNQNRDRDTIQAKNHFIMLRNHLKENHQVITIRLLVDSLQKPHHKNQEGS